MVHDVAHHPPTVSGDHVGRRSRWWVAAFETVSILLLAVLIADLHRSAPSPSVDAPPDVSEIPRAWVHPHVETTGGDPTRLISTDAALARFSRNGLLLPDLSIQFADDRERCKGHLGLFTRGTTPWQITVCSRLEFVITHELAHAWIETHVDEPTRREYLAFRGLEAWTGVDLAWSRRGVEDAAFVIQQNLMATQSARSAIWTDRMLAYELLTGNPSPLGPPAFGPRDSTPLIPSLRL